jgi:hypothetical protein
MREVVLPKSAAPARRGLVLYGALLTAIQGTARKPLAFPILDIANGLTAGETAIACGIAGRARGVFVAAGSIAEGREKNFLPCDHAPT